MSIEVILNHMNRFGRVTICGILSAYNATEPQIGQSAIVVPIRIINLVQDI